MLYTATHTYACLSAPAFVRPNPDTFRCSQVPSLNILLKWFSSDEIIINLFFILNFILTTPPRSLLTSGVTGSSLMAQKDCGCAMEQHPMIWIPWGAPSLGLSPTGGHTVWWHQSLQQQGTDTATKKASSRCQIKVSKVRSMCYREEHVLQGEGSLLPTRCTVRSPAWHKLHPYLIKFQNAIRPGAVFFRACCWFY